MKSHHPAQECEWEGDPQYLYPLSSPMEQRGNPEVMGDSEVGPWFMRQEGEWEVAYLWESSWAGVGWRLLTAMAGTRQNQRWILGGGSWNRADLRSYSLCQSDSGHQNFSMQLTNTKREREREPFIVSTGELQENASTLSGDCLRRRGGVWQVSKMT